MIKRRTARGNNPKRKISDHITIPFLNIYFRKKKVIKTWNIKSLTYVENSLLPSSQNSTFLSFLKGKFFIWCYRLIQILDFILFQHGQKNKSIEFRLMSYWTLRTMFSAMLIIWAYLRICLHEKWKLKFSYLNLIKKFYLNLLSANGKTTRSVDELRAKSNSIGS